MKNFISSILAFVVLFTSTGFTVSTHSCAGEIVNAAISIVPADVSCGMEQTESACDTEEMLASNCCHDEVVKVQLSEELRLQLSPEKVSIDFVLAFIDVYFQQFQFEPSIADSFSDRAPPPLIRDIPVAFQSFLI